MGPDGYKRKHKGQKGVMGPNGVKGVQMGPIRSLWNDDEDDNDDDDNDDDADDDDNNNDDNNNNNNDDNIFQNKYKCYKIPISK